MAVLAVTVIGILTGWAQEQRRDPPPPKPKAAVYIMGNPAGRDALRMAVNTFLVKSGKYQMVAVDAIDVVAKEHKRQMDGSVSDAQIAKLGADAGAQYVCVVERSELDGYSYVATRMVSVESKVAEFADMVKLPYGGDIIEFIQWQIGSMLGMAVGPRPGSAQDQTPQRSREEIQAEIQRIEQRKREEEANRTGSVAPSTVNTKGVTMSGIQGTIVPGGSLAEKLAWLQRSADSHNTYIIEVNTDESVSPYTFEYKGAINITVVIRGVGGNRNIRLSSHGTMFTVKENVTFVLDNNVTLLGHSQNTGSLVLVNDGIFKMNNGSTITGNIRSTGNGGGVSVIGGTFTMNGGIIYGNTAQRGGGVFLDGGGLHVKNKGSFQMVSGIISGNTASRGGGVYFWRGNVSVRGGTITGNTAREYGGGLMFEVVLSKFEKTNGTITGYASDPSNGNAVKDEDGNIIARRGHAVYVEGDKRKETTVGPGINLTCDNCSIGRFSGAWDQ
jgi:hypothetical protein